MFKSINKTFLKNYPVDKPNDNEVSENNPQELTTENLKNILDKNIDVNFRQIFINNNKDIAVTLLYVDGLVNPSYVSDYILKPLVQEEKFLQVKNTKEVIELIELGGIYFTSQSKSNDINSVLNSVLSGSTALIFDNDHTAFLFNTMGFEKRAITEPTIESVTKGSKDSFVETLNVNTATVRRKIKTPNLVIEQTVVGRQTLTPVAIVHINGLTNPDLVNEVKQRLNTINVDNVLATGFIEEFFSDDIHSAFPQVLSTERADRFCAEIVEGRVGIIIDGIPLSFLAPGTFVQFMQAPEDYSRSYIVGSLIRFMRYALFVITLLLPSLYIAITTFHPEMLPTALALAIAKSREGIAVPVFIETLIMLMTFEALFEAGLRIPRTVGLTVSIVGTIIIGEAAVEAKLVSDVVIVIISSTAIASFTLPNQDFANATRIWRFIIALFSSIIGLYGLIIGVILLIHHLCKMESFGVPYLSPFVSSDGKDLVEDSLLRLPLKLNKTRPASLNVTNKKRQGN